jgi:outer membrane receptor protein involved in Fe transport
MFGAYSLTERLTASGYLRVQSGTPWTARARDYAGAMMNFLEPAGSHRNPTWTNLDLMAAYRLPIGGRARISLEARLLNVFDAQTQLATDSLRYLDSRTTTSPPYFLPYQQENPFFGTGSAFAPPRRLYLATIVNF